MRDGSKEERVKLESGTLTGKLEVVAFTLSLALSFCSTSCAISLAGG